MHQTVTALLVAAVLALGGYVATNKEALVVQNDPLGAAPSGDFYNPVTARQTATIGGNVVSTSSVGAATYTAANIQSTSLIVHTAASALTATLPASSTLRNFISVAGDTRTIYLAPVTTGITLAGGTGTDLNTASSTKFCVAGTVCRLDFVRKSNTDIEVLLVNGN